MKKAWSFTIVFALLFPMFAHAGMIVWTAKLTIVSNAVPEDSVFHYSMARRGAINGDYTSFDNSTTAGTAQTSLTVDALPGVYYDVSQDIPAGWKLGEVVCVNSGAPAYSYPIQNGVSLVLSANAVVTCSFNNSKIIRSKTPVLIVPGIMGTEIYKGTETLWPDVNRMMYTKDDRFMDPLSFREDNTPLDSSLTLGKVIDKKPKFDYTQGLIEEFVSQGYEPGKTLFTFPYDWRKDLSEIATQNLSGQIDYILNQTEAGQATGKVDIIAHSQGGLVVKSLLYQLPEYQTKINKLVFVGTPNLGAPKAAKALVYGDSMGVEFLNMGLDPEEVKTISRNMPSVYELLPSAQYFNFSEGYLGKGSLGSSGNTSLTVKTLNYEETKQYLAGQFLNSGLINSAGDFHSSDFDNFDFQNTGIKTYNIIGCQTSTIGKITQKPDGSFSLDYVAGDETVPVSSAESIPGALNFYALESSHGQMLTQDGIRQEIVNIIAGTSLSTGGKITPFASDCIFNGKKISVHSPVDLHIYDAAGNHVGPTPDGSFENNIQGVSYDVLGHEKFAFLPSGGDYTVKLVATDTGFFSFYSSQVQNGKVASTAYFSQVPVEASSTAIAVIGSSNSETINLDLNGDGQTEQNIGPSAVLDATQSQDYTPPATTAVLQGEQGKPGFYRSNIAVVLNAVDPVILGQEAQTSGMLNTRYNLDGSGYQVYPTSSPISVSAEGPHTLSFFSTDRAGNSEEPQTITFIVDKTLPEYEVYFDIPKKDFVFNAFDAAEPGLQPVCSSYECLVQDSAGNTTQVGFNKKGDKDERLLRLLSLAYNQAPKDLSGNSLQVEVEKNKAKLREFVQAYGFNKKEFLKVEYNPGKDESKIITRLADGKKVKTRERGLKIVRLTTDRGLVRYAAK